MCFGSKFQKMFKILLIFICALGRGWRSRFPSYRPSERTRAVSPAPATDKDQHAVAVERLLRRKNVISPGIADGHRIKANGPERRTPVV